MYIQIRRVHLNSVRSAKLQLLPGQIKNKATTSRLFILIKKEAVKNAIKGIQYVLSILVKRMTDDHGRFH